MRDIPHQLSSCGQRVRGAEEELHFIVPLRDQSKTVLDIGADVTICLIFYMFMHGRSGDSVYRIEPLSL